MTMVALPDAGLATRGALSAKQSAAIAKATPSVILSLSKDDLAENPTPFHRSEFAIV